MITTRNTFHKRERLTLKREIDELFTSGSKSFAAYPLRAVCRLSDFNRAKRQMREAYRNYKTIITEAVDTLNAAAPADRHHSLNIAFIWLSDEPQDSALVERKIKNLLHRIAESLPRNFEDTYLY